MGESAVMVAQGPDNSLLVAPRLVGDFIYPPPPAPVGPFFDLMPVPGASAFSAPSIALVGESAVIAAQGPDNSLMFYWQTITDLEAATDPATGIPAPTPWNAETVAGPGTTFSAPSVAQVGNSSVIAARGPDFSLMFYWQTIGAAPWNPETVAGPGSTTFAASSVAWVGDSSVIAAQGPDNSLMFYWQTIGTAPWHPETVAGPNTTFSAPSIAQIF